MAGYAFGSNPPYGLYGLVAPGLNVRDLDPLPVALCPSGCLFRDWAISPLDRTVRRWRLAFISHSLAAVEAIVAQGLAGTVAKEGTFPRSLRMLGTADGLAALPTAEIRLHASRTAQPFRVWRAGSLRENTRPRDREAIGLCSQRLHQLNVVLVQMVMVVRDICIAVIDDFPGCVSVTVPDRRTSSVFVDGPFNLIG
jgi:hypothetical protein